MNRAAVLWSAVLILPMGASLLLHHPTGTAAQAATLAPSQVAGWRSPASPADSGTSGSGREVDWVEVVATAYCPTCPVCDTGKITKSGVHAWSRGLAVAQRGSHVAPLGSRIYVPRFGWLRVDDTGGGVESNQIDIRMKTHRQAALWGRHRLHVRVASRNPGRHAADW